MRLIVAFCVKSNTPPYVTPCGVPAYLFSLPPGFRCSRSSIAGLFYVAPTGLYIRRASARNVFYKLVSLPNDSNAYSLFNNKQTGILTGIPVCCVRGERKCCYTSKRCVTEALL